MQIRRLLLAVIVGGTVVSVSIGAVHALDTKRTQKESWLMLKYGYNQFKAGQYQKAFQNFQKGAQSNYLPAEWKLAKMLQTGKGTPKDEQAAKKLFEKIVRRFDKNDPNRKELPFFVSSLVELGHYAKNGINKKGVDPDLAERLFEEAAAVYGDAEAQYQLGTLYASDKFGKMNLKNATRWFHLAHQKGHPFAIAELGHMFFYGQGVPENCAKGLALLEYAKNIKQFGGEKKNSSRILILYQDALNKANETQKQDAKKILATMKPNTNKTTDPITAARYDK